jgi:pimeloyl-ACP methyl ester carboxylesterase
VLTPELPATGADQTDPRRVTLDSWARFVGEVLAAESAPAILVGHSRGGLVISRVAELFPERLARLVYVSGYLLTDGSTLAESARADRGSLVPPNMVPASGGITCSLRETVIREALFAECSSEDYEFALAHMTPEPLKPLVTRLEVTAERFGRVPRAYIECTNDRTITLAAQRDMQAALRCEPTFTLDSDHSPFLSHPAALARLLGGL